MIDTSRLTRIVAMFDSPNIAERSAAFLRADEIIRKAGARWRETLPMLYAGAGITLSGVDGGHIDQCRDMLRNHFDFLSVWERKFLLSVAGVSSLTARQAETIEDLCAAIERRRALQAEFGEMAS